MLNIDLSMVEKEEQYIIGRVTNNQTIQIAEFFALQVFGIRSSDLGLFVDFEINWMRSKRSQFVRLTGSRLSIVWGVIMAETKIVRIILRDFCRVKHIELI